MATVPMISFSAGKIHEQMKKDGHGQKHCQREALVKVVNTTTPQHVSQTFATPPKYSDKMMNSIWGLYNRYAPPAFQRNFESGKVNSEFAAPQNKMFGLIQWGRLN